MKRGNRRLFRLLVLTFVLGGCMAMLMAGAGTGRTAVAASSGEIDHDNGYLDRKNATLKRMAARWDSAVSLTKYSEDPKDGEEWGRNLAYATAVLMCHEKVLGCTKQQSPAEMDAYIKEMAEIGDVRFGSHSNPGAWAPETIGRWPVIFQGVSTIGFILHEWDHDFSSATQNAIYNMVLDGGWKGSYTNEFYEEWVVNGGISFIAGELLAGEWGKRNGKTALWNRGTGKFDNIYKHNIWQGPVELNSPTYTQFHWAPLTLLQSLRDPVYRTRARVLTDQQLIIMSHMWMPGGAYGAPQARDYAGGAYDQSKSWPRITYVLFGDPGWANDGAFPNMLFAASPYQPSRALRSLYLDKGNGYTAWALTAHPNHPNGKDRVYVPNTSYRFSEDDGSQWLPEWYHNLGTSTHAFFDHAPWETIMMPSGDVALSTSYGSRYNALHVTMGLYARSQSRTNPDDFAVLYQYHPWASGDKTLSGYGLPQDGKAGNLYDFKYEGHNFERMTYGRTFLSLWDPTADPFWDNQMTAVHIPIWENYGGTSIEAGSKWYQWRIAEMGDTYIAYRMVGGSGPVEGPVTRTHPDTGESYTYISKGGLSGCIIEMATKDQFIDKKAYLDNLQSRHWSRDWSSADNMFVEFDALVPGTTTGETRRIRLEFRPEKRFVANDSGVLQEVTLNDWRDRGPIQSPFVTSRMDPDGASKADDQTWLVLDRPGYEERIRYRPNLVSPEVGEWMVGNVVPNGDFEAGTGQSPDGWTPYSNDANYPWNGNRDFVRSPDRSLRVRRNAGNTSSYSGWYAAAADFTGQTLPTSFTASVWAKSDATVTANARTRFRILVYFEDGSTVLEDANFPDGPFTSWEKRSMFREYDQGITKIQPYLELGVGEGRVYFDNFELKANWVKNPSMESGDGALTINHWTDDPDNMAERFHNSQQAHTGNYSLRTWRSPSTHGRGQIIIRGDGIGFQKPYPTTVMVGGWAHINGPNVAAQKLSISAKYSSPNGDGTFSWHYPKGPDFVTLTDFGWQENYFIIHNPAGIRALEPWIYGEQYQGNVNWDDVYVRILE